MDKSCLFIDHREASTDLLLALIELLEHHNVQHGITEFIVGNHRGFDHLAAKAVITAKNGYPGITLSVLIPFPSCGTLHRRTS